jgi:hypothetical protein
MRRRTFIAGLGSAAAWPVVARGQQVGQRHVGVFLGLAASAEDPGAGEILRPFKAAMEEAGWMEGRNIRFDYRARRVFSTLGTFLTVSGSSGAAGALGLLISQRWATGGIDRRVR